MFAGYWSAEGCNTSVTGTVVDCCCDHLSFFAVLVVNEEKNSNNRNRTRRKIKIIILALLGLSDNSSFDL